MVYTIKGGFCEGEGSNKVQKRIYWLIAIGVCCVFLFVMSAAVPITVTKEIDHRQKEEFWRKEVQETDQCVSKFRIDVIEAISAAYALGGLVYGNMKTTPPFNASVERRFAGQHFPRFQDMASLMVSKTKDMAAYILAPGGVVSQTIPTQHNLYKYDFLSDKNFLGKPTVLESIETARLTTLGPLYHGLPALNMTWQLIVRYPLYNVKSISDASKENFWGFVLVVLDVEAIIDRHKTDQEMKKKKLEYLIYTRDSASDVIVPIRFSGNMNATREELLAFINNGTDQAVLRGGLTWHVCTRSTEKKIVLTTEKVIIIVLTALFCALLLFLLGALVVLLCLREYNGRKHAPKSTPFALVVIGPRGKEEHWELTPDRMMTVSERFAAMLKREIVRHKAFEGTQFHPYTTTIITRNIETALQLCFAVLDGMKSQKIDQPLQELLGEEGRLKVACSIHWCLDARVRLENVNGNICYDGSDISYGGRIWLFAPPNEVLASSAAYKVLSTMAGVEIQPRGSVFLRGFKGRQDFFTVSNLSSKQSGGTQTSSRRQAPEDVPRPLFSVGAVSQGNPLLGCSSYLPHGSQYVPGAFELRASRSETSGVSQNESNFSGFVVDSSTNGSGGGGCGNSSGVQRVSDAPRGARRLNQINVPKTLIELVPTDSMAPFDAGIEGCFVTSPNSPRSSGTAKFSSTECNGHLLPVSIQQQQQRSSLQGEWVQKDCWHIPKEQGMRSAVNSKTRNTGDASKRGNNNGFVETCTSEELTDGDLLARALLRPKVSRSDDTLLREAFELQSVILQIGYESVRTILYYFFSAFKLLLKSLAEPERKNIFKRLAIAFGVQKQNILAHLAVQCFLRYIQRQEETRLLLWNCEQNMRLFPLAPKCAEPVVHTESSTSVVLNDETDGNAGLQS